MKKLIKKVIRKVLAKKEEEKLDCQITNDENYLKSDKFT